MVGNPAGVLSDGAADGETEAAGVVRRVLAGQALPPAGEHTLFEVGVNPTVARALGLELPEAEALTRALRTQEGLAP